MGELASILLDTLTPVFLLVATGWVSGRRLLLDPRTAARLAYFVLGPAFVFEILAGAELDADTVGRVIVVLLVTSAIAAGAVAVLGRLLGRPQSVVAASMLVAVYGNVGNFGLPVVLFEFGEDALPLAGIVLLTVNVVGFIVGITAARWRESHPLRALGRSLISPLVLAVPPAVLVNVTGTSLPLFLERPIALLAQGMIPVLLLTLGLQLAGMRRPRIGGDVVLASAGRLLVAPAAAAITAGGLGLRGEAADVTVVQSAMPAAVFAALIAIEHDLEPDLVTTVVLVTTLASALTLAAVLAVV